MEIGSIGISGGNTYQTFILKPNSSPQGTVFYLEEYDGCSSWRYRSKIEIVKEGDPDYLDLDFWAIMHRRYENGDVKNNVGFSVSDMDGKLIMNDPLASVKLYDPDGIEVPIQNRNFYSMPKYLTGRYNGTTGQWYFDSVFGNDSGYAPLFQAQIKTNGNYHLEVSDGGRTYHSYRRFPGEQNVPLIPSTSFHGYRNSEGSLIVTWNVPNDLAFLNSGLQTSARAWLDVYKAGSWVSELWMTLPTHLGYAIVPETVLKMLEAEGDTIKFGLQLRTNDSSNRAYATDVPVNQLKKQGGGAVIPLF